MDADVWVCLSESILWQMTHPSKSLVTIYSDILSLL